ncbi:MAG: tyrosine decarboxylase MfnA [Candidatus Thorarchaeota archaeon]|jgi:tyrosine decarboxylase/aspartate 1-decarboxylase
MFEEHGLDRESVIEQLNLMLERDSTYLSGHPIASMSTIPHSLSAEIFSKTLEKNAGRLHTFKGSARVEIEVIEMLGDLLHLNDPQGTTTSGGTESNLLAMLAAREVTKRRIRTPEIIAPRSAHSSVERAAWLLGVKLVKTRVDKQYRAAPKAVEKAITKDTIGIFATAGTTYLGQVDPIDEIGKIALDYKIPLHVDAAFGGFVLPFLKDIGWRSHAFDFEVPGVGSVSIDPHKMGLAPIPSGCVIFRSRRYLKAITKKIPYLRGASATQASVLGTRPAASVLATWAIMKHLGRAGYRKTVRDCMDRTMLGKERVEDNLMLSLAIDPIMNILGIKSKEVPLEIVVKEMERKGWRMTTSPVPPSIRVVLMPHVSTGALNALFNDLDRVSTTIPSD